MANYTFTTNESKTFYCKDWADIRTVRATGTFSGGTLAFYLNENDASDVAIIDSSSAAVVATSDKQFNVSVGGTTNKNDNKLGIKVTLTGATSPSIYVSITNTFL